MQPEQQRIMGYFIEEAKEHLQTIENGLLNLQTVVEDPEMVNEIFRAAHSIKGGAAMLGIPGMQTVAHRLEDYFKVLKENTVEVDQKLESLFLQGFDALSALMEQLQSSFGLSEETAQQTLQEVEPVFADLGNYLTSLTGKGIPKPGAELMSPSPEPLVTPTSTPAPLDESWVALFQQDVMAQIRQLLQLFQQPDQSKTRTQIDQICQELGEVGQDLNFSHWVDLLEDARGAVANPENNFASLASGIIPALKSARDLVLVQRQADITTPDTLRSLCGSLETPNDSSEAGLDWLSFLDQDPTPNRRDAQGQPQLDDLLDDLLAEPTASNDDVTEQSLFKDGADEMQSLVTRSTTEKPKWDFVSLEALLTEEATPSPVEVIKIASEASSDKDDFADLDQLLDISHNNAQPSAGVVVQGKSPAPSRSARRSSGLDQTLKVPVKQLDNLGNLVGELVINRNTLEDSQDRLKQFLENLSSQVYQLNELGQKMQDLYERSLLETSLLSSTRTQPLDGGNHHQDQARIGDSHAVGEKFDALEMDRFTGFHSLSQEMIERILRVREAAADIDFIVGGSEQVTRMLRHITTQIQDGLTQSRMVPFAQVAERLPRAVRDISLKCGKQATLDLEGQETLIDKSILERLYDPLTHLVNNAIYHGIESPEVREANGKPPQGVIKIRAFYQGNQAVIAISDDGAGIDLEQIRAKAIQKQLITPEQASTLARQEVYSLLFQPGFSTKEQADDLAGRGVGMDVVRSRIHEIRGVINTDSEVGQGTTFTIRLPLTLSITKALCCVDRNQRIAFPIDGVEDVFDLPTDQVIRDAEGGLSIHWRDQTIPCKPLADLLSYNRLLQRSSTYKSHQSDNKVSIIILRSTADVMAIQVDAVQGEQEIVIKQLSGPVPKPVGISGVTVMGDGRIMPIADVLELVDLCYGRLEVNSNLWQMLMDTTTPDLGTDPTVLIVDDSITVRELLSMTFNNANYRVEQARDGLEAWEKLRSGLPCDLVFCDVEMPRMDGLELLSRLQGDPDLHDLPVAMLTSRGATRHREMAVGLGAKAYFTKPYLEEVLLDAAQRMINGEVLVKPEPEPIESK